MQIPESQFVLNRPSGVESRVESSSQQRKVGFLLARRRYQKGTLILRGKREKVWVGRWLEDELQTDGTIKRIHKSDVLGSHKDFPTKRLAQRELDGRVSVVNSPTYRARPTATFNDLAEKWKMLVMVNHAESSQRSEKSDIKAWVKAIGGVQVRNIDCELLQEVVSGWMCSPKTIKNRVGTFRLIWDKAKAWKYTAETAYDGLSLPEWEKEEQPCFSVDEITQIIDYSAGCLFGIAQSRHVHHHRHNKSDKRRLSISQPRASGRIVCLMVACAPADGTKVR